MKRKVWRSASVFKHFFKLTMLNRTNKTHGLTLSLSRKVKAMVPGHAAFRHSVSDEEAPTKTEYVF